MRRFQEQGGDDPTGQESALRGGAPTPLQVALRRKWSILGFAFVATSCAGIMIAGLPSRFVATAAVAIEGRQVRLITAANLLSSQLLDEETLRTEMAPLRSLAMAERVATTLDLGIEPEYCAPPRRTGDMLRRLRERFGRLVGDVPAPLPPVTCHISVEQAAERLLGQISASNDGQSYVIAISAQAADPSLAAKIANAYADAFVDERRRERTNVSQEASRWLSSYVVHLRAQADAADAAVASYLSSHRVTPIHGETVTSQTLSELNTQLSAIAAEIAQKQATFAELQALTDRNGDAAASLPVLASPIIQRLLGTESDQVASLAELRAHLGSAHPKVLAAEAQLGALRRQLAAEVARTVASVAGELAALRARQATVTAEVDALQTSVGQQAQQDVRLAALMRDDEAARGVYQSMLTRLKEIQVQEGIQQSDARVVVQALPPLAPSYPRRAMMLVGALLASLGIGACLAFLRGLLARNFRDAEHLEEETGLPVLGMFAQPRRRATPQGIAIDRPASMETEALYAVLANLLSLHADRAAPRGRVLLLTSALPDEGKTSFAVALACAAASTGLAAIVVDCDLRRPGVVSMLRAVEPLQSDEAAASGQELLAGSGIDRRTGVHVLALAEAGVNPHQLLASQRIPAALQQLRQSYDVILLDTPPLCAVADALILTALADDVVLVVDWRATPRRAVAGAVQMLRRRSARIAGVVLSKVDLRRYAGGQMGYDARGYFSATLRPGR